MTDKKHCQIQELPDMAINLGILNLLLQRRNRLRRIVKRRWRYLVNFFSKRKKLVSKNSNRQSGSDPLKAGDLVRVRSRDEIRATLDHWCQLKQCSFMEEMWPYCGTTQRVFKRLRQFLDERDYFIKKCSGIVILEGVFCDGTKDFGGCDRSCFFFWREEWLEKLADEPRDQ